MKHSLRTILVALVIIAGCPSQAASADTTVSGAIIGNVTWTKAESPYVINAVTIPSGSSLTIEPGTIIKAQLYTVPFTVDGTLTVGTPLGEQVILTSITDDTVGGDTNGDGATTSPSAGNWYRMVVNSGAHVSITSAIIRCGGATPYNYYTGGYFTFPLIENNGGSLTLDHVQMMHSGYYGLLQSGGSTFITNSTFAHITKYGVYTLGGTMSVASTTFDDMQEGMFISAGTLEFGGNTFSHLSSYALDMSGSAITLINHAGNTGEGGINLNLTLSTNLTLPKDGISYITNYLSVPSGLTLTILPGAVMKLPLAPSVFAVDGALIIGAPSALEETCITALTDDTVGGDTNSDGTSTIPSSGSWRSITLNPGSSASIAHTVIRYGGASPYNTYIGGPDWLPAIKNNGGTLTLSHDTLVDDGNYALLQLAGTSTITDTEIARSDRYGIWSSGGAISMHNSSIHNNSTYGVFNASSDVVDATNNYWGAPDGPIHPIDPTNLTQGTGDQVSLNVLYKPFQTTFGVPTTTPVCTVNCNSNVLFLPGIEGSRLYRPDYNGGTDQLWEPNTNSDVTDLYLNEQGKSVRSDIYTKDTIDEVNVSQLFQKNVYKSFLLDLKKWKEDDHLIADYVVAPYDWRLSLEDILNSGNSLNGKIYYSGDNAATTTPYIIQELRRLAATSRTGKVTIIAHSNGGLVTKALTAKLGGEASSLIDQIIFVAVPQVGTPQAIGALLHGYDQGLPYDFLPVILNSETARQFARTSPMTYNLLPSAAYFTYVDDPVVAFDSSNLLAPWRAKYSGGGDKIHSGELLHTFIADQSRTALPVSDNLLFPISGNESLLSAAETLHNITLDNWTPPAGVQFTEIAGWGEKTVKIIDYHQGIKGMCTSYKADSTCDSVTNIPALEYGVKEVIDGDGTVVVPSALWTATSTGVKKYFIDLQNYNVWWRSNISRKHADILEISELREHIKNVLTRVTVPLRYISTVTPQNTTDTPSIRFTLHSPLTLNLYDNLGNHTGISTSTGFLEENIPGSRYKTYGELKLIEAPASTTLRLVMNGYATGSFTLNVDKEISDTVVASTTFAGVPSSTSTVASITVPQGGNFVAAPLSVDENGDGVSDMTLTPLLGTVVLPDFTPPHTIAVATGTLGLNNWYTSSVVVRFSATDTGSGVKNTFYSLNGGASWNTYATSTPLIVSNEGSTTIQYYSVDNAGNRESTSSLTLKIDKTAPEARMVFDPLTQLLRIVGTDNLSSTTVATTATSSVITDQAGHTLQVLFTQPKPKVRRINLAISKLVYDGVIKTASTTLKYKWTTNTNGTYKMLAAHIATSTVLIESHYRPKKNVTIIMTKPIDMDDSDTDDDADARPIKTTLLGMVIVGLQTQGGKMQITY